MIRSMMLVSVLCASSLSGCSEDPTPKAPIEARSNPNAAGSDHLRNMISCYGLHEMLRELHSKGIDADWPYEEAQRVEYRNEALREANRLKMPSTSVQQGMQSNLEGRRLFVRPINTTSLGRGDNASISSEAGECIRKLVEGRAS